jgi:PAS domain S-box-containing protein
VFESAGEAIVVTDLAGNIQYVNPAFERITGYSRDEALSRNPRILKSGHHDKEVYQELWSTFTSGETWRGSFVKLARPICGWGGGETPPPTPHVGP